MFGLFLGVVVAGLFWYQSGRPRPAKPAPVAEVTRDELIARDGRLYRTNEATPFKGTLIERYPGGMLKSSSLLSKGVLQGISEGWYTNGQLQVQEHFNENVSDGLRTKWYEQGSLMSETMIVAGEHNGTFRRWYENGQLAESIEMKHGQPDGVSLAYHPSGFLKARARLENGIVLEQQSWNDGERKEPPSVAKTNSP